MADFTLSSGFPLLSSSHGAGRENLGDDGEGAAYAMEAAAALLASRPAFVELLGVALVAMKSMPSTELRAILVRALQARNTTENFIINF